MLKALLFDVDETLIDWSGFTGVWVDAERPHLQGVYRYLSTLHAEIAPEAAFLESYQKLAQRAWVNARSTLVAPNLGRLLVDAAISAGVPDRVVEMNACLDAYQWTAVKGTAVFPDVVESLLRWRADGLRLGTVTNSFHPSHIRDLELDALGLKRFFDDSCRITAAAAGYLKPHPRIFEHALERLQLTPDEVVFVGDNPVADIAGAQGAGLRAILRVKSPATPLISGLIVPDAAVNGFDEIDVILDEWFPGWRQALKADGEAGA